MAHLREANFAEDKAGSNGHQCGSDHDHNRVKDGSRTLRLVCGGWPREGLAEAAEVAIGNNAMRRRHGRPAMAGGHCARGRHTQNWRTSPALSSGSVAIGDSHQGAPEELIDGKNQKDHREDGPAERAEIFAATAAAT